MILIDSNALVHRSYHALPPLTNKKGEMVNAVYGFASILLKVSRELKPDYIICVFDTAHPTFRSKEYKQYKAKRTKAPQDLYDQISRVKKMIRAFDIPIYQKKGFEADDIIGTIAAKSEILKNNIENIIVTGDLDMLQLISKKTKVYLLQKGIKDLDIYDSFKVKNRFGFGPKQIVDFKGLKGDPSDNILGVPGVGDKTATSLICKFGNMHKMYQNLDKSNINFTLKNKLIEHKKQALFSYYLATIKKDVPIKFNLKQSQWHGFNRLKAANYFNRIGFRSLINRLPEQSML